MMREEGCEWSVGDWSWSDVHVVDARSEHVHDSAGL